MDMSDEERESIGDYVGRIVHEQATAPYKRRIAFLEESFRDLHELACAAIAQRDDLLAMCSEQDSAYDRLYTDCEQGQRAADEEIARLKDEKEQAEKALQDLALRVPNMLVSGANLVCEVEELTRKNDDQSHALGVLRGDLQAERDKTEGMHREIASVGDINATLRIRVRHLEAEVERGVAEIVKLNDEQDAAYGRGFLAGSKDGDEGRPGATTLLHPSDVAAVLADRPPSWHGVPDPRGPHAEGCKLDVYHTGSCEVERDEQGFRKSAIEVPKVGKDEGEGMLIAYTEAINVRPGDRIRFAGYSGNRFVTVLAVHHRGGKRCDLTVRIPRNDALPSLPYGDHCFTLEHNAVVERDESERRVG